MATPDIVDVYLSIIPFQLLCSESEEALQGDISSRAAAYVAFGLIKIAGAFCVTNCTASKIN